uniref:Tachykinin precursor 1 n=1 Tax=Buteo japonicus TaxID=224669 RepID=A0A8C0BK76_9AVES
MYVRGGVPLHACVWLCAGAHTPPHTSLYASGMCTPEELPLPLEHFLQRMARRPRPQQFFGLMGKRDAGYGQISHKRHKTDSFVGLMGKRSLNSGSSERSIAQNYERRRK